jgi:hypothetical protein
MNQEKEITVIDRVCYAENAINAYSEDKEGGPWGDLYDEKESVVIDLLADLMHYCTSYGIDFQKCIKNANMHYETEQLLEV